MKKIKRRYRGVPIALMCYCGHAKWEHNPVNGSCGRCVCYLFMPRPA